LDDLWVLIVGKVNLEVKLVKSEKLCFNLLLRDLMIQDVLIGLDDQELGCLRLLLVTVLVLVLVSYLRQGLLVSQLWRLCEMLVFVSFLVKAHEPLLLQSEKMII